MGQIIGGAAKPKRCNINQLSQLGTPAAGEHILVSSDNSMNAAGQGNFDCYIVGDGTKAATALPLIKTYANDVDDEPTTGSDNLVKSSGVKTELGKKLDKEQNAKTFLVTDNNGYVVAKIDSEGIHAVNVSIKDGDSEKTLTTIIQILNNAIISEGSRIEGLVSSEQTRAEGVEAIKLDKSLNSESLDVTDDNGYIVARIDNNGLSSVDVKVKDSTTGQLVSVKTLIENEKTRAITEENKKLDHTFDSDKFFITDGNGYKIFQIDATGAHAPNLFEGIYNDSKILIMDNNGYIAARIDADGVHSVKDKHAVACMVLSESYYPTATPTRDSDGNITYAEVMFETGVEGSLTITYTDGNSSSVAVVYGNYNYTITINRDADGNVETVSIN